MLIRGSGQCGNQRRGNRGCIRRKQGVYIMVLAGPLRPLTFSFFFPLQSTGWYVLCFRVLVGWVIYIDCRGRESGGDAWKQYVRWSACTGMCSTATRLGRPEALINRSKLFGRCATSARRELLCVRATRDRVAATTVGRLALFERGRMGRRAARRSRGRCSIQVCPDLKRPSRRYC